MPAGCVCVSASRSHRYVSATVPGRTFPPREGAFGGCPLQGQCAASPRVVGGMVVVGEVTLGEPVRHAFGGGCGGVPITFLRGVCVCVVLLGLG